MRKYSFFFFLKFYLISIIKDIIFAARVAANTFQIIKLIRFHYNAEKGLEEIQLIKKVNRPAILINKISKIKTLTVIIATTENSYKKTLARRYYYL
jgi:hypothetical protein